MSDDTNCKKFSISMPPDLMDWVDKKVVELSKKDRRLKSSRSAVISDAVEKMRELDLSGKITFENVILNEGKETHQAIENLIKPSSEPCDGGLSTRQPVNYRKGGRAK